MDPAEKSLLDGRCLEYRNADPRQPAILFSMNDTPLLEWMGVLREEA
jgi:gentisate 1,2-dioxygenase